MYCLKCDVVVVEGFVVFGGCIGCWIVWLCEVMFIIMCMVCIDVGCYVCVVCC